MTEKTAGSEIQPEENLNHIESPQKSDEAKAETMDIKTRFDAAKYKFKTYLIIAVAILVTINIISATFMVVWMRYQTNLAAVKIADSLDELLVEDLKQQITDDFLKAYLRERYLPEDYFSLGLYVNSKAKKSVVEIHCGNEATGLAARSTGVILNDQGYVITNAHNVMYSTEKLGGSLDNPTTIIEYTVYPLVKTKVYGSIVLYEMDVISFNINLDLAILKFRDMPSGLGHVVFGHHDAVTPGEEIVLMGNALGLGITISKGTVLGTYDYNYKKMVQLDALAIKGNSGAPVFNVYAEVIGLMSFKITEEAQFSGIGYAVSVAEITAYIDKVNVDENMDITYSVSELNS